jgi:isopenicillin N synthase-like dioxygenase
MSSQNKQSALPIIDLSIGDKTVLIAQIGAACREFGFFGLINHTICASVIDQAFTASQALFALPQQEKLSMHINLSRTHRGFDPIGWQSLDLSKQGDKSAADLKESFYIGTEPELGALPKVPNHDENQWPPENLMPNFRNQINAYRDQAKALSFKLMGLISESLSMAPDALDQFMRYPTCTTRLLFYPPQPIQSQDNENQIGSGAHTDWGGITILAQDDAGGLEVRLSSGEWIAVQPRPGMLVINTGDLMQRWTNDLYRSSWHRVINQHATRARYSIAYFFDLDHFAQIETLPSCITQERPKKYGPITAGNHILEMYERTTLQP